MQSHLFWFTDAFRGFLRRQLPQGIEPVNAGKSNRKKRIRHDKKATKKRNVIARCVVGGLKDFRRIATRHDKRAGNFFPALCLVAIVAYWL